MSSHSPAGSQRMALDSVSDTVRKSIMHSVANYTVGFLRIEKGHSEVRTLRC
jgi:hypothetical protein